MQVHLNRGQLSSYEHCHLNHHYHHLFEHHLSTERLPNLRRHHHDGQQPVPRHLPRHFPAYFLHERCQQSRCGHRARAQQGIGAQCMRLHIRRGAQRCERSVIHICLCILCMHACASCRCAVVRSHFHTSLRFPDQVLFCLRADLPALTRVILTLFPPAGATFSRHLSRTALVQGSR
jgi:hypothetical protein